MQLKFLTLGFISAALFSNVVVAGGHGSLVNLDNTNVHISQVLVDILNHLNAKGLLKNLDLGVISNVAGSGHHKRSVLSRRRLAKALARREWEADENEDEEDEDEEDEDEEDEDENEEDEDEEDEDEEDEDEVDENEDEEDEDEADEDEVDESSVSKVARRSTEEDVEEETTGEEDTTEEEDTAEEEDEDEEDEDEEQDEENVMRMSRRLVPGLDSVLGSDSTSDAAAAHGGNGGLADKITGLASKVGAGI